MQNHTFAPIVLFVYNRPEHTRKTVEALLRNCGAEQTEIYIFCDAAKNDNAREKVDAVRDYVGSIKGFKAIHITEREENYGLAKSVISGVTQVVNEKDRVIVMEDDLITSPYFLEYMNTALEKYENQKSTKCMSYFGMYSGNRTYRVWENR